MTKLFNERVLKGDQNKFSGILETLNFDQNYKFINKNYEQRMLSAGDFDERIFLGKYHFCLKKNIQWFVSLSH